MRQAGIMAARPSKELGAQAVVYPPILGHGSQGRVTHRPQAGVLTVRRHGEKMSYSSLLRMFLEVLLMQKFEDGVYKCFFLKCLDFVRYMNELHYIRWRMLNQCLYKMQRKRQDGKQN